MGESGKINNEGRRRLGFREYCRNPYKTKLFWRSSQLHQSAPMHYTCTTGVGETLIKQSYFGFQANCTEVHQSQKQNTHCRPTA